MFAYGRKTILSYRVGYDSSSYFSPQFSAWLKQSGHITSVRFSFAFFGVNERLEIYANLPERDSAALRHRVNYLNSVAYFFRAISLICSRVSCFGGTPGGVQVSRKKPSRPAGDTTQSRRSS